MKKTSKGCGRRGAAKQHIDEFYGEWNALERIQGHQDQSSSDQRACGIYGRLAMSIHRSTAVRAGVNRKRTTDCVHMRPEYFDGMQMHEDSVVMAALRWNNLWSSAFPLIQVLSMKTLQRCGLRIDPVHLIYATQPGISHTSPVHV